MAVAAVKLTAPQRKALERLRRGFLEWDGDAFGRIWPGGYHVQPGTARNLKRRALIQSVSERNAWGERRYALTDAGLEAIGRSL